jgi:hypothetical protein
MHKSIMFSCKLIMTWSCLTSTKNHGIQKTEKGNYNRYINQINYTLEPIISLKGFKILWKININLMTQF